MASATSPVIAATPERVMAVLLDFASYPRWCPFTEEMALDGPVAVGTTIVEQVRLSPGDATRRATAVRITELGPRAIAWTTMVGHPLLLFARRVQEVTEEPPAAPGGAPRARYATVDTLSGALAPLVRWLYGGAVQAGLESVAAAIKARAEAA